MSQINDELGSIDSVRLANYVGKYTPPRPHATIRPWRYPTKKF